jgi:tetratricopeptide (TPR) repeat protein
VACERRYRLLETVRVYAAERLAELGPDAAELVAAAHADWCVNLAEASVAGLRGRDQLTWMRRMEAERANLRAALAWSTAAGGHDEVALRLAGGLGWFWWQRGYRDEAKRWITLTAELDGEAFPGPRGLVLLYAPLATEPVDPAGMARAKEHLTEAVRLLAAAGDRDNELLARLMLDGLSNLAEPDGLEALDANLALLGPDGDPWHLAVVRLFRAMGLARLGRLDDGRAEIEASLELFTSIGDRWGRTQALASLAFDAEIRGEYDRGVALIDEAIGPAGDLGLREMATMLTAQRGNLEMLRGDFAAAAADHASALAGATELGFAAGLAFVHNGSGLLAQRRGDLDRAREEHELALATYRRIGVPHGLAPTLTWLGFAAERRGDAVAAAALQREAFDQARLTNDSRALALALEGLASAARVTGDPERAALLLGAAGAMRASVNASLPPAERFDVDRIETAARAALGEDRYRAAIARGAALPTDEVTDLAAATPPAGPPTR